MSHGGKRSGAGRPLTAPGGAGAPVVVRLNADERAALDRLCVRLRATQSEVIRQALVELDGQVSRAAD